MKEVKRLFLEFIGTYDLKEKDFNRQGAFKGTFGEYHFLTSIFEVYKQICLDNKEFSIIQFKNSLDNIDFSLDLNTASDKEIKKALIRRNIVKKVVELYNELYDSFSDNVIKNFNNHNFFENDKINKEELNVDISLEAFNWIQKGYLKKYILKEGKSKIPNNLSYTVSKELFICSDMNYFLENFNKEYDDDIVRVTTFFKIEKEVEYSYFMFILNYKDHVISFSDLLTFDNPHMVNASRSPERKVENKHQTGGLPYKLIDELEKIRKDTTTLASIDNKVEFHKLKWTSFSQYQKAFTLLIIENLVHTLNKEEGQKLISAKTFINQKLLSGENIEINLNEDDSNFRKRNESVKKHINDLIKNSNNSSNNSEIIHSSYQYIIDNPLYDENYVSSY